MSDNEVTPTKRSSPRIRKLNDDKENEQQPVTPKKRRSSRGLSASTVNKDTVPSNSAKKGSDLKPSATEEKRKSLEENLSIETNTRRSARRSSTRIGTTREPQPTHSKSCSDKSPGETKITGKNGSEKQRTERPKRMIKESIAAKKEAKRASTSSRRMSSTVLDQESDSDVEHAAVESEAEDDQNQPGRKTPLKEWENDTRNLAADSEYSNYFYSVKPSQKQVTSNNTLSSLPKLTHQEVYQHVQSHRKTRETESKALRSFYETCFPQWRLELDQDHNLLFHGYGSKLNVLTKFADEFLSDMPVVTIHGFFPTLSLKDVLARVGSDVLDMDLKGQIQDQAQKILDYFSQENRAVESICFLVHNIDGEALQGEAFQQTLSSLASHEHIKVIASMDHVRTALMWDSSKMLRFNWVHHDISTFELYIKETDFENCLILGGDDHGSRGAKFVLASLTQNSKDIFRILANEQLKSTKKSKSRSKQRQLAENGLSFDQFYNQCREKLLVRSRAMFKSQLQEFRDHKIIQSAKGSDGAEHLYIDMANDELNELMEELE
jgi:origin recognition complex subunit 2